MTAPVDLAELPKAEVHIHLEGAVRPATLEEFVAREGLSLPKSFDSLSAFVEAFFVAWQLMNTPGDYARMVTEYCEDAAQAGVRCAELEFTAFGRPFDCVAESVEAASKQNDVVLRFIMSIPRSLPIEVAWAMLEAAAAVPEVIALGLGGPEDGYPPEPFEEVFVEAQRRGLHSVPHAGEDAGPESVRGALAALKAERIQHGVRSVEDSALVTELAERRIPLAVCPTSNLRLGIVRSLDEHRLRQLWDAGVLVSVNTDDPGFFDCDLVGEYTVAGRLLGLDREGYARLALNSVESSFAPDEVKSEIRTGIEGWAARQDGDGA